MRIRKAAVCAASAAALALGCASNDSISKAEGADGDKPSFAETRAIAEEAYVYAFPMIGYYKAMYEFALDKKSPEYKGPLNQLYNATKLSTPKDTAVVTPNSDTPYSFV